jgi:hypothetical protein
MAKRQNDEPKGDERHPRTYTATAASGASHEKGHSLLPMLIGGLILIVLGMLAVVILT